LLTRLLGGISDSSGGNYSTQWQNVFVPPIQARLPALISGNLTLTADDITQMPYLCGFESQITGRLSPWCSVFTDAELRQYEYSNDLRYYYGMGPGTGLESTMMLPFLSALVDLLQQGPNINGTGSNGQPFALPMLLMSFLNDGQITELVTATGVFDGQAPLSGTQMDDSRLFVASHFVTMRGTVAVERMNCALSACSGNGTFVRILLNDAVYPLPSCHNGPGGSCSLKRYAAYVQNKYNATGNWARNCNVTTPGAPTVVQGASFFTDLTSPWIKEIPPY
jgi:acid phosphatase